MTYPVMSKLNHDTWRAARLAAQAGQSVADAADATRTPESDMLDRSASGTIPRSVGAR